MGTFDDGKNFREQIKYTPMRSNMNRKPVKRYSTVRGSSREAKKRTGLNFRKILAGTGLIAALVAGTLTCRGMITPQQEITITQMQENGVNLNKLNLAEDTISIMKKYDQYFEKWNNGEIDAATLTDNDVINMLNEIENANFNVIKDKMASLKNVNRDDIKLHYDFEKSDGNYLAWINVNEDDLSEKETYTSADGSVSSQISNLIIQLEEYNNLMGNLKGDGITKVNAIKELQKLYQNIIEVAGKDLVIDEKGNLQLEENETVRETEEKVQKEKER